MHQTGQGSLSYSRTIFACSLCFVHPVKSWDKKCVMLMLLVISVSEKLLAQYRHQKFWRKVRVLYLCNSPVTVLVVGFDVSLT